MKYLFLVALILIITVNLQSVQTQIDNPKCDLSRVGEQIAAFKLSGNDKTDLVALLQIRDAISQADVECSGWTFKGDPKSHKVIGPIQLPDGVYKATATTKGYLTLDIKEINADCDAGSIFVANVSEGEGTDGAEHIVSFRGNCKIYLEPSSATASWTLTLEPLR